MARAYEASIEEELTCGVCFELFIDPCIPKDLNCSHVVCELCLKRMVYKNAVDCPECRKQTRMPKNNDVSKLRTNLRVRNLARKHLQHTKSKSNTVVNKKVNGAAEKVQVNHNPRTHAYNKVDQTEYCSIHPEEKIHFFCKTCRSVACSRCVILNHHEKSRHHDILDINSQHSVRINALQMELKKAEQFSAECNKAALELDKTEKNILAYIAYEEGKINKAAQVTKMNVDKQCEELKLKLKEMHQAKLSECQIRKSILHNHVMQVNSITVEAKSVMKTASIKCLEKIASLSKKLTDVLRAREGDKAIESQAGAFHYSPGEVKFTIDPVIISLGNVTLGDVTDCTHDKVTNSKPFPAAERHNGPIAANNNNGILKNRWEEKSLSSACTYDDTATKMATEGLTRQVELFFAFQGLQSNVQNIAANKTGSILAVSESSGNVVHICHRRPNGEYERKYCLTVPDTYGNGPSLVVPDKEDLGFFVARDQAIHLFSASGDYLKSGLTVNSETKTTMCITTTPNDDIILGVAKSTAGMYCLDVHSSDGSIVQSIPVETCPLDIAAIDNNQIAIISWKENSCFIFDMVSVTTQNSFSLGKGFQPKSICYDKETESLLISGMSRKGDGVIKQYSKQTGRSLAQIEQGFKCPCAMALVGSDVLLVGEENSVQLFKVWV